MPHLLSTGRKVIIAGSDQPEYNGTVEITVVSPTVFTFAVSGAPTTPATGVMTAATMGIPERYLTAMLMLIAHWDANREASIVGTIVDTLPLGYDALLGDRLRVLA